VYTLPLTVSSSSVSRNLRSRFVVASEIVNVSSSLSYHAAPVSIISSVSSASTVMAVCSPESIKNNCY
jgi:hypothetical protein